SFRRSMPMRNAASVFPEPVGACTNTCPPVAIAGHASSWAGVGPSNARSNHFLVGGGKTSRALTRLSVATVVCSAGLGFDGVVVGGGTAGCVLAARLSENPERRVCLVEAGPDYGPLGDGRWPPDILDPSELTFTHAWEPGADDDRTLGGRIVGGSS